MSVLRISPDEVRIGMLIQGFEGRWIDHPFWRTKFVVKDEKALRKIRDSGVDAVLVEAPAVPSPAPVPAVADRPAPSAQILRTARAQAPAVRSSPPSNEPTSFRQELARASKTLEQSKRAVALMFDEVRLGKAIRTDRLIPLVEDITGSIERNPAAFVSLARLKAKHEYTYMHSVAVCGLMIGFARELRLSWTATREAGIAGLFHDIGKAALPTKLLDKPDQLDDAEFETVKTHPSQGYDLLKAVGGLPGTALDVCLNHHERFDGQGYPEGKGGDRLSLFTRMSAICDVFDAVTSHRAYKPAWTPTEAADEMRSWHGHFDPELLDTFLGAFGTYPVGALVRLKSQELAIIIGANPDDPANPPLLPVTLNATGTPVPGEPVEGGAEIERIEAPEELDIPSWVPSRNQLLRRFAR